MRRRISSIESCENLGEVTFALDGDLGGLAPLASEVAHFCQASGLGDEMRLDLNLALEELFANALRHGGCLGTRHAVEIRLESASGGVWAEFADRGAAFNPLSAPEPDAGRVGGMGLRLVRGIMQELRYERVGDWNRIRMRRAGKST